MTAPGWTIDGTSHRHDGYRIDPARGHPPGGWVLHADDPAHPVIGSIDNSRFKSLKAAKAAAIHHRVLATRRMKLIRHAAVAALAALATIPAFALMGPGESTRRVAFFAVGLVLVLVAMRELVGVVVIVFSDGWDYGYDLPRVTWIDAMVADVVSALMAAPQMAVAEEEEPAVHVVEPNGPPRRR